MDLIGQELTADRVAIFGRNGVTVEFTRADAQKAGSPEAARDAFLQKLSALGDQIGERCVYIGIAEDFTFTDLECVQENYDFPPHPRELQVDQKSGDMTVTAFDGRVTTIAATDIKQSEDKAAAIEAAIAEACLAPEAKYAIENLQTKDGTPLAEKLATVDEPIMIDAVAEGIRNG